jgi:type IV pilus assembly protein PilB
MQKQDEVIAYILKENILDQATLEKLLEQQKTSGQSLINILRKNELANEDQMARIIAVSNSIEFINLSPDMVDPIAAHMVTYEMVNQHNMIPVRKEGGRLLVAMSSPLNLTVSDQIEMRTGCKVVPLAATPNAIKQAIRYHFDVQNVTRQAIASMRLKQGVGEDESVNIDIAEKVHRAADGPITKLVSSIITGAIDVKASDIHIDPQQPDTKVRYRIDGILRDAIKIPSSVQREVVSHIKVLADMDIAEKRLPQDGHITLKHNNCNYDLRISSLPSVRGEKVVIRILDESMKTWSLDSVVTSPADNQKFRKLAANPYGMILMTGPTGCGKTTTLYSLLQMLNSPERNIVTVEDPVEYCLEGITQVQVKSVKEMSFASALRSILRQDPDIILVGEIRDYETAEIAISAALTGHLVLSTLHTNDAVGAVSRLINLGVPPFLVASAILGAAAQRLVRVTCKDCKQQYSPSPEDVGQLLSQSEQNKGIQLYRGQGCNSCYHTGYRGRKAIYEILCVSHKIAKMMVENAGDDAIKQQAVNEGMRTLRKSGEDEVLNGTTTIDELRRLIDMRIE